MSDYSPLNIADKFALFLAV